MDNALIRAGHGLTLSEKRLVMLAVSKLDSMKIMKPGEVLPSVKITAREYAKQFGVDARTAYEELQAAAKNLFEKKITFFEPAHLRGDKPLKPIRTDMRWVGRCKYHEGEGWVQLAWWPELVPCLTGLKKHFTTYQLQQASAFRSAYSWRLLELLSQHLSKKTWEGWAQYDVEDFKASMDAPPSLSDFAQIRRRIIEPAVKDLREKDGWNIEWEPIRGGVWKVNAVRFEFSRNKVPQLSL